MWNDKLSIHRGIFPFYLARITLLQSIKIKAPCKQTHRCWPTTPNIVGAELHVVMLHVVGSCCVKPVSNFLQCYIQWKNPFVEKIKLYQTFRTLKHTNFSRKPKTQAAKPLKKTQVTIRLHRNQKPRMRSLAPMVDKPLRLSTVTRCRYFQQQHNLLSAAFAMAMGVPPRIKNSLKSTHQI